MKSIKKVLSLVMALALVLSLGITALAADTTITINDSDEGSTFHFYRLLNATQHEAKEGEEPTYTYTVNEKYRAAMASVLGVVVEEGKEAEADAAIIQKISELVTDGAEAADGQMTARDFADAVYAKIVELQIGEDTMSKTEGKYEYKGPQGYYLITETLSGNDTDTNTAATLYVLGTAGSGEVTIQVKENVPSVDKTETEDNDTKGEHKDGQTHADYDIGDEIEFTLTGTVAANYDKYDSYYFAFVDTMSDGLTFVDGDNGIDVNDFTVTIGGVTIPADQYKVEGQVNADGTTSFKLYFEDLTKLAVEGVTVAGGSTIVVKYKATLNNKAVAGQVETNDVHLEYSNDPNNEDSHGKTPDKETVVTTVDLVVKKTDGAGEDLDKAGFTLYKKVPYSTYSTSNNKTYLTDKDGLVIGGEAPNQYVWEQVKVEDAAAGKHTFTFHGLDAGEYKLVETEVPEGYNKADDIDFTVEVSFTTDESTGKEVVESVVVKDSAGNVISGEGKTFGVANGTISTNVMNQTGAQLPSTGGIGTTIFYVAGTILLIGAAILLVAKRRVGAAE